MKREAPKLLAAPEFVSTDLHVLVRQAMWTHDLLFYLNADERRGGDCYWKNAYTVVTLPLIRNMIDCLYNITAILQEPRTNGSWFRNSGFKKAIAALDEDQARYGGVPKWDEWIARQRDTIDLEVRINHLSMAEISRARPWPTLGTYIRTQSGGTLTPHQGPWREYSAMAHGAFEGLRPVAMWYIFDSFTPEDRGHADNNVFPYMLTMHIARTAAILLCIATELQCYFRFDDDGARINERIYEMWKALIPVEAVRELYTERYEQLMRDRRIHP